MMPVEMSERDELIGMYSDSYKDAHGIRPRWMNFDGMSNDEISDGISENCRIANENADAEAKYAQEQVEVFKANVDRYINEFGAGSEEKALEWMLDAEECEHWYHGQNVEQYVWNQGIIFTDYGKELVKKLCKIIDKKGKW